METRPLTAPWIEARDLEGRGQRVLLDTEHARIHALMAANLLRGPARVGAAAPPLQARLH
jgi:hypothetical protein